MSYLFGKSETKNSFNCFKHIFQLNPLKKRLMYSPHMMSARYKRKHFKKTQS